MASSRKALASLMRQYSSSAKPYLGTSAQSGHGPEAIKLWKNLSFFLCLPAIGLCAVNTYIEHEKDHHKPRPEFIPYEHLRIRTKRFPWGEGNKSFFHNPQKNPLPTGYEE